MAEVTISENRIQLLRYGTNNNTLYASNFGTGNNYGEGSQLLSTGSLGNYWIAHLDSEGHAYLTMTNHYNCTSATCPFKKSISYSSWESWSNSWQDYFDTDFSSVDVSSQAPIYPYFELTPYTSTVDGETYYIFNPRDVKFIVSSTAPSDISSIIAGGRVLIEPYSFTYTESESSSSSDYSTISSAIMMIPATMFCLAFFFIIFKLFINKRVRG